MKRLLVNRKVNLKKLLKISREKEKGIGIINEKLKDMEDRIRKSNINLIAFPDKKQGRKWEKSKIQKKNGW